MPKVYRFQSTVTRRSFPGFTYSVVPLPDAVAGQILALGNSRPRAIAQLNGHEFRCGLIPGGEGTLHIMLSKALQKLTNASPGLRVAVEFVLDDPDAVEMPPELTAALDADPEALALWEALTPGKRRGLAYRVASAKTTATREKRCREVLDSLKPLRFGGL